MEIGILGGTGNQGNALARRLLRSGYQVRIGSRDKNRGKLSAEVLADEVGTTNVSGGTNEFATEVGIVVIAIPASSIDEILNPLKSNLQDSIILDMAVNLDFGTQTTVQTQNGLSTQEYIMELIDHENVVGCLKTISYTLLEKDEPIHQTDIQIAPSDKAFKYSKQIVEDLGIEVVRVKERYHALTIERMTALSIDLNKAYPGSHIGYKLSNIEK